MISENPLFVDIFNMNIFFIAKVFLVSNFKSFLSILSKPIILAISSDSHCTLISFLCDGTCTVYLIEFESKNVEAFR